MKGNGHWLSARQITICRIQIYENLDSVANKWRAKRKGILGHLAASVNISPTSGSITGEITTYVEIHLLSIGTSILQAIADLENPKSVCFFMLLRFNGETSFFALRET